MKFADWMRDVDGVMAPGLAPDGVEVADVTSDSRDVGPHGAFVALKGAERDGAAFVRAALERGAVAILSDRDLPVPAGIAFARLDPPRRTMALLARKLYGEPDLGLALIGVTGTNGKTTTTTLIRQLLMGSGLGCGLVGTVLNAAGSREEEAVRTTPESPALYRWLKRSVEAGDVASAVEVSSHSLMLDRVFGCRFKVGLFTNLTQDHLDFHGDMETYFQAKRLLFQQCALKLANADDPYGRRLLGEGGFLGYAIEGPADYRAEALSLTSTGTAFHLVTPRGAWDVKSPLLGRFNAYNLLAALAALAEAGFDLARLLPALQTLTGAPGRLDRVDCGQPFGVMVDYAHTPDALEKLLTEGRRLLPSGARLHVLFGCGGDRDRAKRPLMARVVAGGADVIWHTSDNTRREDPELILDDGASGIPGAILADPDRYHRIADRVSAVGQAVAQCRPGDLLLLAGKGHEPYQDVQGVKHPYSDRGAAESALRSWSLWSLKEVQGVLGGKQVGDGTQVPTALSMDSRALGRGDCFVAVRGQRDGHAFAAQAVAGGAGSLLVDHELPLEVPQLIVQDTVTALHRWGQARLEAVRPGAVFAITGSVGKTSTKELLAAATGAWKTPGNRNNTFGVPGALATLPAGLAAAVVEMGMSTPGEIATLTGIAPPDFAVITNIGTAHIENFVEGQAGIALAKGELVAGLRPGGIWVYLASDSWCRWVALQPWASRARAVAVGPGASYGWEDEVFLGPLGARFTLRLPTGGVDVRLRMRGAHQVRNAALAGAIAVLAGFDPLKVAQGLGSVEPDPGRGRLHALKGGGWLLDESYNASQDAILACATSLLELEGGEPVAVLGCMRELGPRSEGLHRETGEALKALGIKRLLAYGDLAEALARGFGLGGQAFPDYDELRDDALGLVSIPQGARILVKGSRFWRAERAVDWLLARL